MKKVSVGVTILVLLVGIAVGGCQTTPRSPYLGDNISRHSTVWNPETKRYEAAPVAEAAEPAEAEEAKPAEAD